jgi:RNA polymerase sigma-70 factor, ECF subfamily
VHDTYVRAFTHLDSFKGRSSLATWLARIVSNEALGRMRRRRPTVDVGDTAETLAAGDGPFVAAEPTPEQAIARSEIRGAIEKAVDELPPSFRSVFMLRAIEQMSIEETASCLGYSRRDGQDAFPPRKQVAAPSADNAVWSDLRRHVPVSGAALRRPRRDRSPTHRRNRRDRVHAAAMRSAGTVP